MHKCKYIDVYKSMDLFVSICTYIGVRNKFLKAMEGGKEAPTETSMNPTADWDNRCDVVHSIWWKREGKGCEEVRLWLSRPVLTTLLRAFSLWGWQTGYFTIKQPFTILKHRLLMVGVEIISGLPRVGAQHPLGILKALLGVSFPNSSSFTKLVASCWITHLHQHWVLSRWKEMVVSVETGVGCEGSWAGTSVVLCSWPHRLCLSLSLLHDIPVGTGFIFSQRLSKAFFRRTVPAPDQGITLLRELCWNKEDTLDKWEITSPDQPKLAPVTNAAFLMPFTKHPSARGKWYFRKYLLLLGSRLRCCIVLGLQEKGLTQIACTAWERRQKASKVDFFMEISY